MSDETKQRRVLPDQPALAALNKCAKILEKETQVTKEWVIETLTALYTGWLPDKGPMGQSNG